jgi:hypothetical protein
VGSGEGVGVGAGVALGVNVNPEGSGVRTFRTLSAPLFRDEKQEQNKTHKIKRIKEDISLFFMIKLLSQL